MPLLFSFLISLITVTALSAQVTFTEFPVHDNTHGPACVYPCDLDRDGDEDVLVAVIEDRDIAWFRNEAGDPPLWTKFIIDGNMISAHSVHANDLDGDGDLDVLGTSYGSSINWYENDGQDSISWTRHTITAVFTEAHEVSSADIDGDNDIDVLGASSALNRITLWLSDGGSPPQWTEQVIDSNCGMAKSVAAADLDGDGLLDILSAALLDNDVKWYRNGGGDPIQWTTYTIDANFGGAHRVQAADMDNDGDNDVICAGYLNHQIAWWRNNGGSPITWTKQIIARNFANACIAQAADIDLDGRLDVIGSAQGTNWIFWWQNGGGDTITWTENIVTLDFYRVWPLCAFDADADGDSDLVAGSSFEGNNQVRLWRNDMAEATGNREHLVPDQFALSIYPNPFNSSTVIRYSLPRAMPIRLRLFNSLGQEVATIANRVENRGSHEFRWNAADLSSGIYWLELTGDGYRTALAKAVFIR
ncbi:MAG: FG-GAP-like repeat-containing protein [Calditrichota bacterium]